jgi:hypothetical protein
MLEDMQEAELFSYRRRRLPLAFRLSLILMLIAVLPPLLIVGISEYTARPILINQANQTMETDAQTRIQLIDAYLQDRLSDLVTVSTTAALQQWIIEGPAGRVQNNDQATGISILRGGVTHDPNYLKWVVTDINDAQPTAYPPNASMTPQEVASQNQWVQIMQHDPLPSSLDPVTLAKLLLISPTYFDPAIHKAFIDIYMPIFQINPNTQAATAYLGFLQAQLSLDHIWGIVDGDKGIAHSGNSFILDNNGVRIADSSNHNLFTAVAPLPAQVRQLAARQDWYGTRQSPRVQANTALETAISHPRQQPSFTMTPYGQTQPYQAALSRSATLPWTYVVTSPSSVVTQTADQQLLTTIAGAIILLVLAAIIGLMTSNRISRPIMHSVAQLRENSEALNSLAQKQQSASSEQLWVIDAVKVGLQSVQYYTDATRISAHKMGEIGVELKDGWRRQDIETIRRRLQEVIDVAQYIEKAADYQTDSSQKLTTAIKVTSQVNDQLADGSISATEAAKQLKLVVNDLRNVVGQ